MINSIKKDKSIPVYFLSFICLDIIFIASLCLFNIERQYGFLNGILFISEVHVYILLHEFGHYIYYVVNKVKINAVYLFPFWIIDKKVKDKLYFKVETSFMGIVIPEISNIETDWYIVLREKISGALVIAPTLNFLILVISTIIYFIRPDIIFFKYSLIINAIMLIMAFYGNDSVLGDFVAYKHVKNNEMYSIQIMYNYYMKFSNVLNIKSRQVIMNVLKSKIVFSNTILNKRAFLYLIEDELKYKSNIYNLDVDRYLNVFYQIEFTKMNTFTFNLTGIDIIIYERSILYYLKVRELQKANLLYGKIADKNINNFIFLECKWIIENGECPWEKVESLFCNVEYMNYLIDERIIIDNLNGNFK